ncbi:hypothetical protein [Neolewinella antarctica]|uniref:Uncharacterized protein n=1 Tax=Neolewinella antarctica TaxID=442734 RepID=A0ABX0X6Y6_9BACT|nr:hypothetical protein [Neolewinella antarctica]NJC24633.1 hypothetical protein [Neolewinella antarctica]
MRIIGRLPHPEMQITVFSNDGRFPVQFELLGQTQQYRFRHAPELKNLGDIARIVDEQFKAEVLATFKHMRATQARVVEQHLTPPPADELPEII